MVDGVDIKNAGNDNFIDLTGIGKCLNCEIIIVGDGNRVKISPGTSLVNVKIQLLSNGNVVEIGEGCRVTASIIMKLSNNNLLMIGDHTTIGGCNFICGEGTSIVIGRDCMLAWNLEIRSTDSHAIVDVETGQRINQAENIVIDDHVWIGAHATVLKGAHIARDSVVSIRSVVTGEFEESGVILGGAPARKLRSGINWKRPLLG